MIQRNKILNRNKSISLPTILTLLFILFFVYGVYVHNHPNFGKEVKDSDFSESGSYYLSVGFPSHKSHKKD